MICVIFRQIVTCFLTLFKNFPVSHKVFLVVSRCVIGHVTIFRGSYFRNFVKLIFWVTAANSFFTSDKSSVVGNRLTKQFKIRPTEFWNFWTWKILTLLSVLCWTQKFRKIGWFRTRMTLLFWWDLFESCLNSKLLFLQRYKY